MPKPLLKTPKVQEINQTNNILSTTRPRNQQQIQTVDKMKTDRILRQRRSKEYMDAIHKLDAGGHVHNKQLVDEILNALQSEFPEVKLSGYLLGYVAICYLGKPYEVHTLDPAGQIIEHYQVGHPLPNGLEKARSIAIRGGYDFIEVYTDCCRAISEDGTVSVITD